MTYYLQKVQADQGNLSHHAVQADQQYRADQPNPEDLKDRGDPERENRKQIHCLVNVSAIFLHKQKW